MSSSNEPVTLASSEAPHGAPGLRPWRPALVRAPAGRPNRDDGLELVLWAIVLLLAFATPARTADGQPNAPLMQTLEQGTGGGLCMWKRLLGRPCAGCGLTRGFVQLAHGHPIEAVRLNPATPIVFGWVAWRAIVVSLLFAARRRLVLGVPDAWESRFYVAFGIGFVVLFVVRFGLGVERL